MGDNKVWKQRCTNCNAHTTFESTSDPTRVALHWCSPCWTVARLSVPKDDWDEKVKRLLRQQEMGE